MNRLFEPVDISSKDHFYTKNFHIPVNKYSPKNSKTQHGNGLKFLIFIIGLFTALSILGLTFVNKYKKSDKVSFGSYQWLKLHLRGPLFFVFKLFLYAFLIILVLIYLIFGNSMFPHPWDFNYNKSFDNSHPFKKKIVPLVGSMKRYAIMEIIYVNFYALIRFIGGDALRIGKLLKTYNDLKIMCRNRLTEIALDVRNKLLKYDPEYRTYLKSQLKHVDAKAIMLEQIPEITKTEQYIAKAIRLEQIPNITPVPHHTGPGLKQAYKTMSLGRCSKVGVYYPDIIRGADTEGFLNINFPNIKIVEQRHYMVDFCENMARFVKLEPNLTVLVQRGLLSEKNKKQMLDETPLWACNWEFGTLSRMHKLVFR